MVSLGFVFGIYNLSIIIFFDERKSYKSQIQVNIPYIFWIIVWRMEPVGWVWYIWIQSVYRSSSSPLLFLEEFLFRGPLLFASMYLQFPTEIGLFTPSFSKDFAVLLHLLLSSSLVDLYSKPQTTLILFGEVFFLLFLCVVPFQWKDYCFSQVWFCRYDFIGHTNEFANWIQKNSTSIYSYCSRLSHLEGRKSVPNASHIFDRLSICSGRNTNTAIHFFYKWMEPHVHILQYYPLIMNKNFRGISMLSSSSKNQY